MLEAYIGSILELITEYPGELVATLLVIAMSVNTVAKNYVSMLTNVIKNFDPKRVLEILDNAEDNKTLQKIVALMKTGAFPEIYEMMKDENVRKNLWAIYEEGSQGKLTAIASGDVDNVLKVYNSGYLEQFLALVDGGADTDDIIRIIQSGKAKTLDYILSNADVDTLKTIVKQQGLVKQFQAVSGTTELTPVQKENLAKAVYDSIIT